jgi:cytochrome b561
MQWRNTSSEYGLTAILMHWLAVAGVIAQYLLAEFGEDEKTSEAAGALTSIDLHISIGVAVLALMIVRLAWRLIEGPPAWPATMKRYEIRLARGVHLLFYVLLIVIPISGWALATADGQSVSFFGLFELPSLRIGAQWPVQGGSLSEDQLEAVHEAAFNLLVVMIVLHVVAVMKHRWLNHEHPLRRMLPHRSVNH